MLAILVIVGLLSMLACYLVARSRQADPWYWVVLAVLIGPLAIPFTFFAKPKK